MADYVLNNCRGDVHEYVPGADRCECGKVSTNWYKEGVGKGLWDTPPISSINSNFDIIDKVIGDHADSIEQLKSEMRYIAAVAIAALALVLCTIVSLIISW